ncbi:hypothetical protein PC129_g22642 [Phytophthora cactorum]|uniref:Uncharacterized protein n=2 Tax=Phytophthora cactorum TaxID=29920 RepID=A0A8T1H2B8_9STRA|nr:hypothetical protein PC129_g22642 [Phytophthora cactorum]
MPPTFWNCLKLARVVRILPPAREQFQSVGFAQLQQQLRYQKAQAAQTASNIQVELGTQVVRLHDRVAALEKLAYAASSSSASRQG